LCPSKKGDILFLGFVRLKTKQGKNMSSTDIVRDSRTLIQNKLLPAVPRKWLTQVSFGIQAYSLQAFQSATGNARRVVANPNTAARKSERLLANLRLAEQLGTVFDQLGLIRPSSYLNIDHSDMYGLTALVGAVQTRNGRAIPAMVETTYALHIPASGSSKSTPRTERLRADMRAARRQQSFTGHTIDALQNLHDRLGFWPKGLVFDRGFGNESIVTHLAAEGATFYIRLKGGRYVEADGQKTEVKQLKGNDTTIRLYGITLRVIRSPKSRRAKEPWYILTNDRASSRNKVVRIYYHRFEIEESFKDLKHIFEFRRVQLTKPNSLKVLLWLIFLGFAVLYVVTKPTKQTVANRHPKKRVSWLRQAMERMQQAYGLLLWGEDESVGGSD
jgi:hypothetical protein